MANQQAPRYDHVLNQGAEYRLRAIVRDENGDLVDLTGFVCEFRAATEYVGGDLLFDLISTTSPSFIDLTADGIVSVNVPASETANYVPAEYYYTMKLWPNGQSDNSDRVLEGIITVKPEVKV